MTSKKRYKKQISSLKEVIKDHIEKIEQENLKDSPNIDRIRHWEKEIDIYDDSVKKAKKRLERGVVLMSTIKNKKDKVLFDDLKDECVKFIKLMNQLNVENLTEDQEEEILGEMFASLTHLNVHSGLLKKQIES